MPESHVLAYGRNPVDKFLIGKMVDADLRKRIQFWKNLAEHCQVVSRKDEE